MPLGSDTLNVCALIADNVGRHKTFLTSRRQIAITNTKTPGGFSLSLSSSLRFPSKFRLSLRNIDKSTGLKALLTPTVAYPSEASTLGACYILCYV